ncbi:MAG: cbb3-type cytochrome c oxidase N-terminal domain-containing protein, partial [bacterium]
MKKLLQTIKPAIKIWLALSLLPAVAMAQEATPEASFLEANAQEILIWALMGLELIMLLVVLTMFFVIKVIADRMLAKPEADSVEVNHVEAEQESKSFLDRILTKLNDAVPVEREMEVATDHEYDGIVELDNNLPPWWKALFYITIVFGVAYLLHYHVFKTGELQGAEYETEMALAKAEVEAYLASSANNVDETNVTFVDAESRLANGETIFTQKCAPCHGQQGEGTVGPNLTDEYWIHGGDVKDIFKVIKHGVPAKGMIPWKSQLSPAE